MWTAIMSVKSSCSPESKIRTTRTGQSESLERCINSFYYSNITIAGKLLGKEMCISSAEICILSEKYLI